MINKINIVLLFLVVLLFLLINLNESYKNFIKNQFTVFKTEYLIEEDNNKVINIISSIRKKNFSLKCDGHFNYYKNTSINKEYIENKFLVEIKARINDKSCIKEYIEQMEKIESNILVNIKLNRIYYDYQYVDKENIKKYYILNNIVLSLFVIIIIFRRRIIEVIKII